MRDAIEAFANHVVNTGLDDIPDKAIASAKTFLLDTIGVGLAGSTGPHVQDLLRTYGGPGPSRILGQSVSTTPGYAALVNGYQIHNSEFDCVHEAAVIHTMTVLLAVLLADADRRGGINGDDMIRASVLGVDVACNLGVACTTGLRFFRPATTGSFAAVAAVAAARGYDKDMLLRAFALNYTQLSGTMQAHTEGSPLLALQIGVNARNALSACDWAENGLPGLSGVLEGPFGYYSLFEGAGDIHAVLPTFGKIWRITEVAHKPFPSGRATHGIVDAIRELRAEYEVDHAAVARIAVRVPQLTHHLIGRPVRDDMAVNYARLNGQYAAAVMLRFGTIRLEDYSEAALCDADTLALANKVAISIDDNPDPNALSPVEVDLHMSEGSVLTSRIETVYGNPTKPMSRDEQLAKFQNNWRVAACGLKERDADVMIDQIDMLEKVSDIRELIDLATDHAR